MQLCHPSLQQLQSFNLLQLSSQSCPKNLVTPAHTLDATNLTSTTSHLCSLLMLDTLFFAACTPFGRYVQHQISMCRMCVNGAAAILLAGRSGAGAGSSSYYSRTELDKAPGIPKSVHPCHVWSSNNKSKF